ncbi:unnamed protein product [Polarella glacialis]|uniref:Uncharacterized protein n=1 Tax=Polarella glacialis TaxID=89957 RepID=A0A813EPD3_POLGL|nr:unnamed protein product [Polarella glacialis]
MSPGCYSTVFSIEIAFCLLAGAFAARPGRDDLLSSEQQQQHHQQQQKQPEPAESLELCEMIRDTVCQYDASDNTLFFHGFTGACGSVLKPLCERRCEKEWCESHRIQLCHYDSKKPSMDFDSEKAMGQITFRGSLAWKKEAQMRCGGCGSTLTPFCKREV